METRSEGGTIQNFSYGSFQWLHTPANLGVTGMSLAQVTIGPREQWPIHDHPNYEQCMHVLSGLGFQQVNGRRAELRAGYTCYIPSGSSHQMTNTADEDLVYLAVFNPVISRTIKECEPVTRPLGEAPFYLRETVSMPILQQIQDKVANSTELGVLMIDQNGRLLTRPTRMPRFCKLNCFPDGVEKAPATIRSAMVESVRTGRPYCGACCAGVMFVAVPIMIEGHCAGTVACGFSLLDEISPADVELVSRMACETGIPELKSAYTELEVVLHTRLQAAAEALELITITVVSLALDSARQRVISETNQRLATETKLVADLEHALNRMRLRILEAHINPHFLFNSLSVIASLVADDPAKAMSVVYALSDFLRYSLKQRKDTVTIDTELTYLESYVEIQQARFGSSLRVNMSIDRRARDAMVPFLLFQPLVENAIIHGLDARSYNGQIDVIVKKRGDRVHVMVKDDGDGAELVAGRPSPGGFGFGLRYVEDRLKAAFDGQHELVLTSRTGQGTTVDIKFPFIKER